MKEYALYKGDDLIGIGTIKELAELTGVRKETIKFYGMPSHIKRRKSDNFKILVKLEWLNGYSFY